MRAAVLALLLVTCGCQRSFQSYFDSGEHYLKAGKYAQAIIQFQNAARRAPKSTAVHVKLGDAYMAGGDRQNAAAAYARACGLDDRSAGACVQAGRILLALGDYPGAAKQAEVALQLQEGNVEAELILGNALVGMGRFIEADRYLRAAVTSAPESARAHEAFGELQLRRGNTMGAEVSLRKAIALDGASQDARVSLARAYLASGRPGDAARELQTALQARPLDLGANQVYASYLVENDQCQDAEPYWKTVAAESPDASGSLALADYYVSANRPDDALRVLSPLMSRDADGSATTRAASIAYDRGDRTRAIALADEVLTRDPFNLSGLLIKARMALGDGDAALARDYASRAVTVSANAPAVRQLLAQLAALDKKKALDRKK